MEGNNLIFFIILSMTTFKKKNRYSFSNVEFGEIQYLPIIFFFFCESDGWKVQLFP